MRLRSGGALQLALTNRNGFPIRTSLVLRSVAAGRSLTLGSARLSIAGHRAKRVTLRVSAAGRRALDASGGLYSHLSVVVADRHGRGHRRSGRWTFTLLPSGGAR
jgi:hypothetical protein